MRHSQKMIHPSNTQLELPLQRESYQNVHTTRVFFIHKTKTRQMCDTMQQEHDKRTWHRFVQKIFSKGQPEQTLLKVKDPEGALN